MSQQLLAETKNYGEQQQLGFLQEKYNSLLRSMANTLSTVTRNVLFLQHVPYSLK